MLNTTAMFEPTASGVADESLVVDSIWLRAPLLALVVIFTVRKRVPGLPEPLKRFVRPFKPFLKPYEAEERLRKDKTSSTPPIVVVSKPASKAPGRNFALAALGLLETLSWFSICAYKLVSNTVDDHPSSPNTEFWNAAIFSLTWLYATLKPAIRPKVKPHYDLFTIYLISLVVALLEAGGYVYLSYVYQLPFFRDMAFITFSSLNILVLFTVLVITLRTRLAVPVEGSVISPADIGTNISPEDYTTLWNWITFAWVTPITQRNIQKEEDVWKLSPLMATRAIYSKYVETGRLFVLPDGKITPGAFFWHYWACNSLDFILEFGLSFVSLTLEFAGPLFLKLILDSISKLPTAVTEVETRKLRAEALLYAFSLLACNVLKAGTDMHHLFYGRRGANRARNQIMMAIYEKALRRREVMATPTTATKQSDGDGADRASGTRTPASANGTAQTSLSEEDKKKQKAEQEEEEKKKAAAEAADLGKIVNLMSTDTRTVESMIYMCYWFYNAPFQLVLATLFLYKLLGWSAFAGVGIFILIAPVNHLLSGRAVKIYGDIQTARDKKMSVLNEMISEIKFIKFLANEDRWMKRALDARAKELRLVLQSGYVDIGFNFIWGIAPIGVSILAFWAYIWSGHRLSVSTAFTAVQLFSMLSQPLGVLPMVIVRYLKVKVSVGRIATYLSEPEVDPEVSSFKQEDASGRREGTDQTLVGESRLGIQNGYFLWSKPEEPKLDAKPAAPKKPWWKRRFWVKAAPEEPLPSTETGQLTNPLVPPVNPIEEAETVDHSTLASGAVTPAAASPTADRRFELRDINVIFPSGQLSLVTGPTASGKTALLRALLGEMYIIPPPSELKPSTQLLLPKLPTIVDPKTGLREYISYAAQTPWLEHLTIKQNILFGSEYDEERYNQVVDCCALRPDLETFEDGDETEIGERGVSLSGGQKARVALARAIYAPTQFVLLDDPLSAVDSHTARFLFERLLSGPLLAKRTVVLVTHHVELVLPGAGYLVRMLDGRIDTQGSINELQKRGLLSEITAKAKKEEAKTEAQEDKQDQKKDTAKGDKALAKKLVDEEEMQQGRVKFSVYLSYIKASAYITWVGLFLFTLLGVFMAIVQKAWMQVWGEAYETPAKAISNLSMHIQTHGNQIFPVTAFIANQAANSQTLPTADENPMFYVWIYVLIGLASLTFEMLGSSILVFGGYRASRLLFGQLLDTICRATMRWYDVTPTGRILNRLSKDFETIDTTIGFSFSFTIQCFFTVILSVLTIVLLSPLFLIPGIVICAAYVSYSKLYLEITRPLKRLDSTTLSPVFASFRTSLEGLATIRAFSAERRFLDKMNDNLDVTTKCYWALWMVNRWLLFRFDVLGGIAVFCVMAIVALFGGNTHQQVVSILGADVTALRAKASNGFEGLLIVSAMGLTMAIYWLCRFISQLELDLNAVERVTEYLNLPQEPPSIIESARPPAYWPSSGGPADSKLISVENLVIKYAPDLPSVLQGVSFDIKPRERVGLVGRTGSGKSTLATALLRFVEPVEGHIVIDGIDISTIGLYDLRSRVTFIQQDSVLFSGTIRENLDPFNEYSDEACLDVLRRVHLIDPSPSSTRPASIRNSDESTTFAVASSASSVTGTETNKTGAIKLDSVVTSSGSNFSHGQRQLIALARALLRKTTVIIMDEATSSIDFETDNKIQLALREEFASSCVITIAHRLQTIIDYDRVIVMENGKIVENGSPAELMSNTDGNFYGMCAKAGMV